MSRSAPVGRAQHNIQNQNLGQNAHLVAQSQAAAARPNNRWLRDRAGNIYRDLNARGTANRLIECLACEEKYKPSDLYRLECGHWHCEDCLKENVRIALGSNPFSPARCCLVISIETLQEFGTITDGEYTLYENKMEELTNPRGKVYCWGEDCGAFIPFANQKRRVGECTQCGRKTCKACQAKSHFGPCDKAKLESSEGAEEKLHRLAERRGWKRCPNCNAIVQKNGGCNHIR
ncbi:hypothetical protein F5Y12DRAFT_800825 [Xylaria sp. FL1777]|nr:hypothetical protein F5Y12DRAFT_800825 [Xylaria sp. FL1777]